MSDSFSLTNKSANMFHSDDCEDCNLIALYETTIEDLSCLIKKAHAAFEAIHYTYGYALSTGNVPEGSSLAQLRLEWEEAHKKCLELRVGLRAEKEYHKRWLREQPRCSFRLEDTN